MEGGKLASNLSAYYDKKSTPVVKAYKNSDFLASSKARNIRIMCELDETKWRLRREGVSATVLFFGSARAKSTTQYETAVQDLEAKKATLGDNQAELDSVNGQLERIKAGQWMCEVFDKVTELSRMLTEWSVSSGIKLAQGRRISGVTRYHGKSADDEDENQELGQTFVIATGGGPGFMEAANMGAAMVPGAKTIGMAITLPFEEGTNRYVTDELAFEYHYFFTRKFWMMYYCQALVVAPGGVGTMDELFEVLTLKQTGKVQSDLPVVLLGATFWRTIINWEAIVGFGVVSKKDYDDLFFTDSVEEAYAYITTRLTTNPIFEVSAPTSAAAEGVE